MKTLILSIAMTLGAHTAQALEIKIPCRDAGDGVLAVTAVKVPFKDASGKWNERLFLESAGRRFELVPAGSGDEDYNEFKVKGGKAIGIQSAYVQNRFAWVSLIDTGGFSFAKCSK